MKVDQQPGYLLHRRAYRESSLLVEIFTRNHGRLALLAKGCRRNKSRQQGLFLSFKPLLVSWAGKGELPILTAIEQTRYCPQPDAPGVACGFYMNELILKLLHRHDPHERLYDKYDESISALIDKKNPYVVLRIFEKYLLQETGFGLVLEHDAETGQSILADSNYQYLPQKGPVITGGSQGNIISGATLIALQSEEFKSDKEKIQARLLTRWLIDIQLHGKELRTRRVVRAMKRYTEEIPE